MTLPPDLTAGANPADVSGVFGVCSVKTFTFGVHNDALGHVCLLS